MKWLLFAILFFISACQTLNIRTADRSVIENSQENNQSENKATQTPFVANYVGVIVSPGLAHTLSAAHFFTAAEELNLKMKVIAGVGWGAVPAAIYADSLKANALKWQFYKLEKKSLLTSEFFGLKKASVDKGKQQNFYSNIFRAKKLASMKAPFVCSYASHKKSQVQVFDTGNVTTALNLCSTSFYGRKNAKEQDHFLALFDYFKQVEINNIILVTNSNFVKNSSQTLEELESWANELSMNIYFVDINTDFISEPLSFKKSKDILRNSRDGVFERVKKVQKTIKNL